jgi:hypothetical protein
VNAAAAGLSGTGEWTVSLVNGWATSTGASYDVTFAVNGLCATETGGEDVLGCTEPFGCNYIAEATVDDGSCIFPYDIVYVDEDGDGYGGDEAVADWCPPLESWLSLATGDCDDSNNAVHPGAFGTGEGIDNNCDGILSTDEAGPSTCPEDVNVDGFISVADVLMLLGEFGCTIECEVDVDGDEVVTVADILQILRAFGSEC